MYERHGSSSTIGISVLQVGQIATLSSAAFLFSLGLVIQFALLPQFKMPTQMSWEKLNWVSQLQIKFETPTFLESVESPEALASGIRPLVSQPKPSIVLSKPASRRVNPIKKVFASKRFSNRKLLGKVASEDEIVLTESKSISPQVNHEESVDSTERGKLVQMHRFLTVRFLVAMNAAVPAVAHARAIDEVGGYPLVSYSDVKATSKVLKESTSTIHPSNIHDYSSENSFKKVASRTKKSRKIPVPVPVPVVLQQPALDAPVMTENSIQILLGTSIRDPYWKSVWTPSLDQMKLNSLTAKMSESQNQETAPYLDHLSERLSDLSLNYVESHIASMSQSLQADRLPLSHPFQDTTLALEVNSDEGSNKLVGIQTLNTQTMAIQQVVSEPLLAPAPKALAMNTQAGFSSARVKGPISGENIESEQSALNSQVSIQQAHPLNALVSVSAHAQVNTQNQIEYVSSPFVEAFDLKATPIASDQVMIEPLTDQTVVGTSHHKGWVYFRSPQHWKTLAYFDESNPEKGTFPLISDDGEGNGIQMLSALTGLAKIKALGTEGKSGIQLLSGIAEVKQQESAGIVFGKVKAGWQVRFEGRSEIPVFLDLKHKPVSEMDTDQDRYFIYLNVEPGKHSVLLRNTLEGSKVTVLAPVLGGKVATYLNFTQFHSGGSSLTLAGNVHDEVDFEPSRLVPSSDYFRVTVFGQEEATDLTQNEGYFKISKVNGVGAYPILLQVTDSDPSNSREYTHRYQVAPISNDNLVFYRVLGSKIRYWQRKGPGEVDAQNGIVVAMVPGLVDAHPETTLIPNVYSIYNSSSYEPKVFTVSPKERPLLGQPLQAHLNRFVAFDIIDGPAIAEITNEKSKKVFSELIFASPNVVNVVGPY